MLSNLSNCQIIHNNKIDWWKSIKFAVVKVYLWTEKTYLFDIAFETSPNVLIFFIWLTLMNLISCFIKLFLESVSPLPIKLHPVRLLRRCELTLLLKILKLINWLHNLAFNCIFYQHLFHIKLAIFLIFWQILHNSPRHSLFFVNLLS